MAFDKLKNMVNTILNTILKHRLGMKRLTICFLVAITCLPCISSELYYINNDSILNRTFTSYLLYKKNSAELIQTYERNAPELNKMNAYIRLHKKEINSNKSHLLIVSYVNPTGINNAALINLASIRASVIRAYIKVKHGIAHEHVTFAIDTVEKRPYVTSVTYVPQPADTNYNPIYYTLKNEKNAILCSVQRYPFIPFVNRSKQDKEPEKVAVIIDKESAPLPLPVRDTIIHIAPKDSVSFTPTVNQATVSPPVTVTQEVVEPKTPKTKAVVTKAPFIGVKTNFLYWSGITPDVQYKGFMPNLEVEWYIKKQISLNMELVYTYLEENNTNREMWGLSAVSIEPRYWLAKKGQYNGWYAGCYGLIGDFDVKKNRIETDGDTGDFYEAGITMGYHLPISSHWGVELGAKMGYRTASGDTYYFDDPHYYRRTAFSENKLKVTGLRIMLVYRFHKSIKKGGRQ